MAEKFQISEDEASRIKEALKKPEFRKLLVEYAEEISDPENKKRNEEELIALEKQRGVDMKYIHPKPGFVMKSFLLPESTRKIFINVCHSDVVSPASSTPAQDKTRKKKGEQWSIPYSLAPPREDTDKSNNKCTVVDAVFNTDTLNKGTESLRFKQVLVDTVFDGLEEQLHLKVDREKVVYLRMPYKGVPVPAVIRTKMDSDSKQKGSDENGGLKIPFPPLKEEQDAKSFKKQQQAKEKARVPSEPQYSILHRGEFSMQDFTNERESSRVRRPQELVVSVELPGVESAAAVQLDIFEKRLHLESETPLHKLDLALPYPVNDEKAMAKFEKSKQILTITLPVVPPPTPPPQSFQPPHQPPLITEIQPDATNQPLEEQEGIHDPPDGQKEGISVNGNEKINDPESNQDSPQELNEANVTSDSKQGGEWSSASDRDWVCPLFSYRQDEDTVVFCLHTPGVKESTLVRHFDDHCVQLAYSTDGGERFSFHVTFPEPCALDVDDCSVDVGEENLLILLMKGAEANTAASTPQYQPWERFYVGLNASQTTEKLFLTTSNVESVIEKVDNLPNPWTKNVVWSDSATVATTLTPDGNQLNIEISDSSRVDSNISDSNQVDSTEDRGERLKEPAGEEDTAILSAGQDSEHPNEEAAREADTNITAAAPPSTTEDCTDQEKSTSETLTETTSLNSISARASGPKQDTESEAALATGPAVRVEEDGSVFIRGDSEYMRERHIIKAALGNSQQQPTATDHTPSSRVKLTNKLLYSLD